MNRVYYPARLFAGDAEGVFCVSIPGINVNAQGDSHEAALTEAAEMLQDVVDHLAALGHPIPEPGLLTDTAAADGSAVVLPAYIPALVA